MKISIIIPNYNGEQLLKKNLPGVFEALEYYMQKSKNEVEVVLIDDFSTDNSLETIKYFLSDSRYKNIKIKILQNEKNQGFPFTANKGIKEATGEIVILLNTDVVPEKDFLEPLILHFGNSEIFAVGCMDKSLEGTKIVLRGRGLGKWEKGFLVHRRGEVDKANTLWVNGGSGAFRKSIWEVLGGFNLLYSPFYWEDIDLSYRAIKSGYKVMFEPKSIVAHEHDTGAIKKTYSSFQIRVISYRNQFIFVWLNSTDLNLQIAHVFWLPYHLWKAVIHRNIAFFLGFFRALFLLPAILYYRSRYKKNFKKTDKETIILYSN